MIALRKIFLLAFSTQWTTVRIETSYVWRRLEVRLKNINTALLVQWSNFHLFISFIYSFITINNKIEHMRLSYMNHRKTRNNYSSSSTFIEYQYLLHFRNLRKNGILWIEKNWILIFGKRTSLPHIFIHIRAWWKEKCLQNPLSDIRYFV